METYHAKGKIDSGNAALFEKELMAAAEGHELSIDAEELQYISSAGLRVLMKLTKKQGHLTVFNVNRDVYEILEVTGFTEILDIKKALRFVSIEGLQSFAAGATGAVYRLDADTIVKVFYETIDPAVVCREREQARKAFLAGIRTAIPYDVVKTEKGLGVVYEMLKAEDMRSLLQKNPEKKNDYLKMFADIVREMHQTEVDPKEYKNPLDAAVPAIPYLTQAGIINKEQEKKLYQIYQAIPARSTFIHGDCHLGNVMVTEDEAVLIDMASIGSGHPIIDLVSMNLICCFCAERNLQLAADMGFTNEELLDLWYTYIGYYFQTDDRAFLEKATKQVEFLTAARMIFIPLSIKGFLSQEIVDAMKETISSYTEDALNPLLF